MAGLAGGVELMSERPSGVDANIPTRVFQQKFQRVDGFCVPALSQRSNGDGGLGSNQSVGMDKSGEQGVLRFGAVDPRG